MNENEDRLLTVDEAMALGWSQSVVKCTVKALRNAYSGAML